MNKGVIELKRNNRSYTAGFGIVKENLVDLSNDLSFLHPQEEAYFHSLKFDRRKASYLLGRKACKVAINELFQGEEMRSILIDFGVFEFPVVKSAITKNLQVCISHCDEVGMALAFPEEHPLGMDIEKVDESKIDAVRSQLSANELDLVSKGNIPAAVGYIAIWTIKESLSKIFKTGLTADFKVLEVQTFEKAGNFYVSSFLNFMQYRGITGVVGDYICTIVLPKNTQPKLDVFWHALINNFSKMIGFDEPVMLKRN